MEEKELNLNEIENEDELIECTSDELIGQLAVQEEVKRIEIQDNPTSKCPKDVKESEVYKELTSQAHVLGECLHILLGYGIDYANAVSLASNLLQNKINMKTTEMQQIQLQGQVI